jgi:hypothetical protein
MVVKKTLRTMMLAAASVLGSVAVAQAQPAPPAPPPAEPPPPAPVAPPAPPPPPAAEFGVAPAALPAAPASSAPVPTVSFGSAPAPDSATATPEKKGNPFFFTRFNWGNTASTKIFGVGADYGDKSDEQYTMEFSLSLRYYLLNETYDKVWVNAGLGFATELTNSDSTLKARQPLLNDTSIGAGYSHMVYRSADKSTFTTPSISATLVLPTSLASRAQSKYLSTRLGAGLVQGVPLGGPKSDWFSDVTFLGSVSWTHLFSNSTTAVNDLIAALYKRQTIDPEGFSSPQMSGSFLAKNSAALNFTYYLTIYKDLSLGNTWGVSIPDKYQGPAISCVQISTGCVALDKSVRALNPVTTFDIGLSYTFFNTARIDLGYQSIAPALGDNGGKRRSIFYGPDASFYGNVSVYLDTIIDKAISPAEQKKLASSRFTRGAY